MIRSSFGSSIYFLKRAFFLQCCIVLMSANGELVYGNSQWTNGRAAVQWQQQHQWQQQEWHRSDEDEAARLDWYNLKAWSRSKPSAASLENSGMPANDQHWLGPSEMQLENERQAAAFANAVSVPPVPRARASRAKAKAAAKAKASGPHPHPTPLPPSSNPRPSLFVVCWVLCVF